MNGEQWRIKCHCNECQIERLIAEVRRKDAEIERLRSALESIAKNTCCDKCQEAALVAREALEVDDG